MKIVTVLDTSVASRNLGDRIICDAVYSIIGNLVGDRAMVLNIPTHERISRHSRRIIQDSAFSVVAGTNLLSSKRHLVRANLWNATLLDALHFERVVFMGVGSGKYGDKPSLLTKLFYRNALDSGFAHSVRDAYTKQKLQECGISKVINTGCPTTWNLSPEHCAGIPADKAQRVVFTVTDYHPDRQNDRMMIDTLQKNYSQVYCWLQGTGDFEYLKSIVDPSNIKLIPPDISRYNQLLEQGGLDYVGTRLHAGIRALQKGIRTLIVGIDNRAIEMGSDIGLHILLRSDMARLESVVNQPRATALSIDFDAISSWKSQFSGALSD